MIELSHLLQVICDHVNDGCRDRGHVLPEKYCTVCPSWWYRILAVKCGQGLSECFPTVWKDNMSLQI